mmetsp:Transcript_16283/g.25648  ORF Transcript_16283/g.25648 Transcript_16283/m.25648 type:complete len:352 (+) Transcript_16283:93-1148(+)
MVYTLVVVTNDKDCRCVLPQTVASSCKPSFKKSSPSPVPVPVAGALAMVVPSAAAAAAPAVLLPAVPVALAAAVRPPVLPVPVPISAPVPVPFPAVPVPVSLSVSVSVPAVSVSVSVPVPVPLPVPALAAALAVVSSSFPPRRHLAVPGLHAFLQLGLAPLGPAFADLPEALADEHEAHVQLAPEVVRQPRVAVVDAQERPAHVAHPQLLVHVLAAQGAHDGGVRVLPGGDHRRRARRLALRHHRGLPVDLLLLQLPHARHQLLRAVHVARLAGGLGRGQRRRDLLREPHHLRARLGVHLGPALIIFLQSSLRSLDFFINFNNKFIKMALKFLLIAIVVWALLDFFFIVFL